MPDRQNTQHRGTRLRMGNAGQRAHLVQQVAVGEWNALGLACRAGGVQHRCHGVPPTLGMHLRLTGS